MKALLAEPRVLLLDEPTTALGPEEIEQLHALVFERSRTGVGVVYVSHRLPEVLGIADRITVLRDGVSQGTFDAAGMSENALVALMIGRPLGQAFPDRDSLRPDEVCLEVTGLQGDRFGPIDLEVHRGEILGIAGAEGNGQVQFLRSVAGVEHSTGTVRCNGGSSGHAVAGRPTQSRRRCSSPATGPGSRCFPCSAFVRTRRSRFCGATAGWAFSAAGASGEPFSISCAAQHPDGVGRAARAVAVGRKSAEGLPHAPVPAGLRACDPRRRADPGRRRRLSLRHLRGAARQGEGGDGARRQVERSPRARRASAIGS